MGIIKCYCNEVIKEDGTFLKKYYASLSGINEDKYWFGITKATRNRLDCLNRDILIEFKCDKEAIFEIPYDTLKNWDGYKESTNGRWYIDIIKIDGKYTINQIKKDITAYKI